VAAPNQENPFLDNENLVWGPQTKALGHVEIILANPKSAQQLRTTPKPCIYIGLVIKS
jgi:hypothetical protein